MFTRESLGEMFTFSFYPWSCRFSGESLQFSSPFPSLALLILFCFSKTVLQTVQMKVCFSLNEMFILFSYRH